MRAVRLTRSRVLPGALLSFIAAQAAASSDEPFGHAAPSRPVATVSIVAIDEHSGEIGAAVVSHWFSVGSIVIWAEAGVGAVATQSFVEPGYGPEGLAEMRKGKDAAKALARLLRKDEHPEIRQVAFVDAEGGAVAHTGEKTIGFSCDAQGFGFSVQANLMQQEGACAAMAAAFEHSSGDLATRMIGALRAAENAGGSLREKRSAALIVAGRKRQDEPWRGREIDLRVDDNAAPIDELARLVTLNRAYNLMRDGDIALAHGRVSAALDHYRAASALAPQNDDMVFWQAVTLAAAGEIDTALPLFSQAFAASPQWRELIPRLPGAVILPDDPALIARILAVTPDESGQQQQ